MPPPIPTPWILVTPSSRGLGLAFARHLLRTTNLPVVATARGNLEDVRRRILEEPDLDGGAVAGAASSPDAGRTGTRGNGNGNGGGDGGDGGNGDIEGRLNVVEMDFCDEDSIASAAEHCRSLFAPSNSKDKNTRSSHLHLALILPGILHPEKSPSQLSSEEIHETFNTNVIGPMLLTKHFHGFLPRKSGASAELPLRSGVFPSSSTSTSTQLCPPTTHATWAHMSARVGSISDNALGGWYSYRASKAALNQHVKTFDNFLRTSAGERAIAVGLHPGTVRTGLSRQFWGNVKEGKLFEAQDAVEKLCGVLGALRVEQRGRVWDWKGDEVEP